MIHVCFCFRDKTGRYAKFVGTSVLSVFENISGSGLPVITVHILHDNTLTNDNRDKFSYLAGRYGQIIKFYNVENLCADKIEEIKKFFPGADRTRFSIGMFYRFLIPYVLPLNIEKSVYLDADVIVNLDINELWRIELNEKILAAVPVVFNRGHCRNKLCLDGFVKSEDYFNSGVLLMNLRLLRGEEKTVMNGVKFISCRSKYGRLSDQDILNYCFAMQTVKLPGRFNQYVYFARKNRETVEKKIYHYAGVTPGWTYGLDMNDSFNTLWIKCFAKTPWFNAAAIGRLREGFLQIQNDLMRLKFLTFDIMYGKTRAFFIPPYILEAMKKFFAIRDDELIIPAENETSIQKLIDAMNVHKGKYVFFIMTPTFRKKSFPFALLTRKGFTYNEDFVKGWEFLSADYGNPINSYPLIQAM